MPSYQQLLEELMASRGPDDPIWEVNDKIASRELAELCDIRVPRIYQGPCSLRTMSEPEHDVVIKPVQGCSGRGVRPLVYEEGLYRNLFDATAVTWSNAVADALADKHTPRNLDLLERSHPDAMRPPWFLEELFTHKGRLPHDWKGFCIDGRVRAIFQLAKSPKTRTKRIKWWSRDYEDLGNIQPAKPWRYDNRLPEPSSPISMIQAMEDIAELVDSPFIRVDLYEHEGQPVFGELTPHPTGGTVRFRDDWDEILGKAWLDAI